MSPCNEPLKFEVCAKMYKFIEVSGIMAFYIKD